MLSVVVIAVPQFVTLELLFVIRHFQLFAVMSKNASKEKGEPRATGMFLCVNGFGSTVAVLPFCGEGCLKRRQGIQMMHCS